MTAEKIAAADHLDDIAKALTYAAQCLDGVVSMDEEDEGKDGGSATCQSCLKLVNRALGKAEKVRPLLEDYDRLKARVAEMEAALEPFANYATADGLPNGFLRVPDGHPVLVNGMGEECRTVATIGDFRRARALLASRPLPTKGDTNG